MESSLVPFFHFYFETLWYWKDKKWIKEVSARIIFGLVSLQNFFSTLSLYGQTKTPCLLQKSIYNIAFLVFSYVSASNQIKQFSNVVLGQIKTSTCSQILWQSCLHQSKYFTLFHQVLNATNSPIHEIKVLHKSKRPF